MIVIKNRTARNLLRYLIPFGLIPATVALGAVVFSEQRYLIISLGVAVLALLLFAAGVEQKNIGSRRMVIVAVMIALAVVGRFIPLFKPITAVCVLTALSLGAESGFLCGAMSILLSNIYFGQGPWTPFQMLGFGLIGLFAGYLSPWLKKSAVLLALYGVAAGIGYSFIMDIWTVLWYSGGLEPELYLAAILSALPYTALYAVSNVVYLLLLRKPISEKLDRIKRKYGL